MYDIYICLTLQGIHGTEAKWSLNIFLIGKHDPPAMFNEAGFGKIASVYPLLVELWGIQLLDFEKYVTGEMKRFRHKKVPAGLRLDAP